MVVDSSEGLGKDYHAFTIIQIQAKNRFEVVAKYRNNELSPLLYPTIINNTGIHYNTCPILVESNSIGYHVVNSLYEDLEYDEVLMTTTENGRQVLNGIGKAIPGVKTSKQVKAIGCSTLKTLIESNRLITNDATINDELKTFIAKGSSFEADQDCTDDTVATLFLFAWMTTQSYFNDLFDSDIRKSLEDRSEDLLPFDFGGAVENTHKIEEGFGVIEDSISTTQSSDEMSFF
jgi:hypothetical protein